MKKSKKIKIVVISGFAMMLALVLVGYFVVLPAKKLRMQYPVKYENAIRRAAAEFQVDAALVATVARIESSYIPTATSSVGARGLMQIMPETGAWIAKNLGEEAGFSEDSLYDVGTSLRYGSWYLKFLTDLFGNDLTLIAAGYHSGQDEVQKWLKDSRYSQDGVSLTTLPEGAPKTRNYVEKIRKAYSYYEKKYR